jgi:thiol-disulfide isomerase/thioredoxin
MVVLAVAGCGSQKEPATAEKPKFRPVDDSQPAVAATESGSSETTVGQTTAADVTKATRGDDASAARPAADKSTGAAQPGSLPQLLVQFEQLEQQQPKGSTQEEQLQDFVRIQQQRLNVGKKILAGNPDKEAKQRISRGMYEIHMIFARLGVPTAKQQLADFAKSLINDSEPDVARLGRHMQFDSNVSRLAAQQGGDGKDIVAEVQRLLDSEKGQLSAETLQIAGQAAEILMQTGSKDEAVAAFNAISKAAEGQPELADQAAKFEQTAQLVGADLTALVSDTLDPTKKDAEAKLVATVKQLIKDMKPSRELFGNLQQVAQVMEYTGHLDAAKQCYQELASAFKESSDEKLATAATQTTAGAEKRLGLVGQPLAVEGLMIDGKPFDWSVYQGKVVLLDFWATWCRPCLEELPNVQRNFQEFHAKGFEVVGVNLNTSLDEVKQFLMLQDLPWATVTSQVVVDGNAGKDWSQLPMAAKCGVDAIPFLVLIGPDGNVDSIHVRGPKLKARLTQLLGEPITTEVPADPTRPADAPPAGKTGALWRMPAIGDWLLSAAMLLAEPADDGAAGDAVTADANPYGAKPGLSPSQLAAYIEKQLDKPLSIQTRKGFAEAIVEACDRLLAAKDAAKDSELLLATETKLSVLHREAIDGKEEADKQLTAFVEQLKDDARPKIAREVRFYRLERRALGAGDLPAGDLPKLFDEVEEYAAKEKLAARDLRLASGTVKAINRIEDGDEREARFTSLGGLLAKSTNKEVAAYGKKIAKKPAATESDLVGTPLELTGSTSKGKPFRWDDYRGRVVLVDFWATWCGPCRKEMPHVKELYEKRQADGLAVVGISVDKDQAALAQYLEENQIAWETVAGDETQKLAKKYGVRGIPTMVVVDRQGKIAAVAHNVEALHSTIEKLLADK